MAVSTYLSVLRATFILNGKSASIFPIICAGACKYADWKPHEGFRAHEDFWEYPRTPFLCFKDFDCSAALRCQLALIDSDPDVLHHIAPNTDVRVDSFCLLDSLMLMSLQGALRFRIGDQKMSVSFRRIRDTAFMTRDSECIAILAQTLVAAVELENSTADSGPHIDAVYRQLGEEYAVHDVKSMIVRLQEEYKLTVALPWFHEVNMAKHKC
ncbi:hypothetical protein B0H13DRAFT_1867643 [Mycena leptocephala]|nr:hypothetical protein B0H13DRAFT_1867643 [Mycena leptocephala]